MQNFKVKLVEMQAPAPAQCPNGDSTATLSEELEQGPYYVNVSSGIIPSKNL